MKTSLIALATLSLMSAGLAVAPVQAATLATCSASIPVVGSENMYLNDLIKMGVPATSVSDWGECLSAPVVKADGTTGLAIFDPDTLQKVAGDSYAATI